MSQYDDQREGANAPAYKQHGHEEEEDSRPSIASKIGDLIGINSGNKQEDTPSRGNNYERRSGGNNPPEDDGGGETSGVAGKIGSMLGMSSSSSTDSPHKSGHHHKHDDDSGMHGTSSSSRDRVQGRGPSNYDTTDSGYGAGQSRTIDQSSGYGHSSRESGSKARGEAGSTSSGVGMVGTRTSPDYTTSGSRHGGEPRDDSYAGSGPSGGYTRRAFKD